MVGSYGTAIPIHINPNEIESLVDISYCYNEKRTNDSLGNAQFKPLQSSLLSLASRDNSDGDFIDSTLEGMYNLQLPISEFNKKGFYTVYIKPKETLATILDVSTLSAYSTIRGVVIDTSDIDDDIIKARAQMNGGLVGFRMVLLNEESERETDYRLITSNNKCEPMIQTASSSSEKNYTYRYCESSSLTFLTVSPSSAPTFNATALPYIGKSTQQILLVNTMFEPIMLDIELTSHDADTISYMLENSQLRNLDAGLVTTFNDNNEIYHQTEHSTLKDSTTGRAVYELKQKRTENISFTETLDDKIS